MQVNLLIAASASIILINVAAEPPLLSFIHFVPAATFGAAQEGKILSSLSPLAS